MPYSKKQAKFLSDKTCERCGQIDTNIDQEDMKICKNCWDYVMEKD